MHCTARRIASLVHVFAKPCACQPPVARVTLDKRPRHPGALVPPRFPLTQPYSTASGTPSEGDQLVRAAQAVLERARGGGEEGGAASIGAAKREKELEPLRAALREVEEAEEVVHSLEELASSEPDPDMRELALADLPPAHDALTSSLSSLRSALLPSSPESSLSALLEFKPGVGGSEATLFAAEMVRMYQKLAARKGWRANVVESVGVEGLGAGAAYKEALMEVTGEGAFGFLRREAGVHRVQRVPATETKGRVHTSTVAVLVLPAESANQEIDDSDLFDMKDVKIETMRSRGAGGQHVNRTESAIRLTHGPTGITVSMQDSRSQHDNRVKAFRVLRARLLDRKLHEQELARRSARRGQVSGTDRSDKIRTYSFSQGRITDHRIGLTLSAVEDALEGGESLDMINVGLEEREEKDRLEELLEG
ncbi:hypothetical protein JCM10207_004138 [Rhodosporidiobolus poonsookiae]